MAHLNCPSLDYVYRMTWAEFCIRKQAFLERDREEWIKTREIAYAALTGPHWDYKKLPRNKMRFMPIKGDPPEITDAMKLRMREVITEFNEAKKALENG